METFPERFSLLKSKLRDALFLNEDGDGASLGVAAAPLRVAADGLDEEENVDDDVAFALELLCDIVEVSPFACDFVGEEIELEDRERRFCRIDQQINLISIKKYFKFVESECVGSLP